MTSKILIVRKMSSLEYYYSGAHRSEELRKSHEEHDENIKKILEKLEKVGFMYKVVTRDELTEPLVDEYDFVFSAGGDGTVIATAAFNRNTLQLNLKTDEKSKGNLCHKNLDEAVNKFLKENYKIENWTRQDVYLDGEFIGRVLNETAIGENMNFTKMTKYIINTNSGEEYHRNSGLIIVTGTGSTGWPSAFSPYSKIYKKFKFLTILPCEGNERGEGDYFKIKYLGHEGKAAIDTVVYDFPRDSILEIKVSENPLKIIVPKSK